MYYINQRIRETGAEVVINFYELLTGLTYALFRPSVPYICVGHQYLFYIVISSLRIKFVPVMDAAFLYPDDRSKIFEETGFVFPGNGTG